MYHATKYFTLSNKLAFKYRVALKKYSIDIKGDFEFIDEDMIKKIYLCSVL